MRLALRLRWGLIRDVGLHGAGSRGRFLERLCWRARRCRAHAHAIPRHSGWRCSPWSSASARPMRGAPTVTAACACSHAFINGLALLAVIAAWIVIEAVRRLDSPVEILAGPMLAVAFAGFVVNVIVYLTLRGGTDLQHSRRHGPCSATCWGRSPRSLAATIILATGWTPADPLLSIVVAALIVRTGWHVTRESGHALLRAARPGFDAGKVERSLLEAIPELQGVHHVHAPGPVGADDSYVTLHVCAADSLGPDSAVARVQMHLAERFGYQHITVQVEYGACADQALTRPVNAGCPRRLGIARSSSAIGMGRIAGTFAPPRIAARHPDARKDCQAARIRDS